MRAKLGHDYPTMLGITAILLGVAVILGIIFTYADFRQPGFGDDIAARIAAPNRQQLPSDL